MWFSYGCIQTDTHRELRQPSADHIYRLPELWCGVRLRVGTYGSRIADANLRLCQARIRGVHWGASGGVIRLSIKWRLMTSWYIIDLSRLDDGHVWFQRQDSHAGHVSGRVGFR